MPRAPATNPAPAVEPAPAAAVPRKPVVVLKRGGGFYQDDGPGDNPPDNLHEVPDPQPRLEPLHRFANNPYAVFGKAYEPQRAIQPYRERGIASWYGRKFHGQKTASGEPYDMYGMSAAHPTLPIPSFARVTNLENGQSVVVRVNDRGPFHANRVIDLSYTAAYRLGFVSSGSAQVEVEAIVPEDAAMAGAGSAQGLGPRRRTATLLAGPVVAKPATAAATASDPIAAFAGAGEETRPVAAPPEAEAGRLWLQLAAFSSREKAHGLGERVRQRLDELADKLVLHGADGVFRVRAGPFASGEEARRIAARIAELFGIQPLLLRR